MSMLLTTPPKRAPGYRPRGRAAAAVLAVLIMSSPDIAWPLDLETVLANTSVTPPDRVDFREERHNPMFKEPLVLTGHLEYPAAGVLRKVIETPFEESFLIQSDHVVIERGGETRKLPLQKSRSLRTILGAIEAILAGQSGKLEAVFDYQLGGTVDAWSVVLTPVSGAMRRQLTNLQVTGNAREVTQIRIALKGNEWHVMDILHDDAEP